MFVSSMADPARNAFVVTPHDVNLLKAPCRSLWIGGAGTLTVITLGGDSVLFSGIPAGTIIPIQATRVMATGTTATLIVALV